MPDRAWEAQPLEQHIHTRFGQAVKRTRESRFNIREFFQTRSPI
jgi:hypothetical protein